IRQNDRLAAFGALNHHETKVGQYLTAGALIQMKMDLVNVLQLFVGFEPAGTIKIGITFDVFESFDGPFFTVDDVDSIDRQRRIHGWRRRVLGLPTYFALVVHSRSNERVAWERNRITHSHN